MQNNRPKIIFFSIIIGIGGIIALAIISFIIDSQKTATLETLIAPSFAKLTINGKTYHINQKHKFKPGNVTIHITADGFQEKEFNITLNQNETTEIYEYLTPKDGNLSWYDDNPKERSLFYTINDAQAIQNADAHYAENPISTILPLNVVEVDPDTYAWTEYRIDGGKFDNCKKNFCVKITDTTGGNREKALQKIREKGFNPDDYEIIYDYVPVIPLN